MINSRDKGAKGEREIASKLREYGFDCRRGCQFNGADGSADVIGLPKIHLEIKRVERLNITEAMSQAKRDCKENTPVVMHRKNNEEWLVTMTLAEWIKLYREWENSEFPSGKSGVCIEYGFCEKPCDGLDDSCISYNTRAEAVIEEEIK